VNQLTPRPFFVLLVSSEETASATGSTIADLVGEADLRLEPVLEPIPLTATYDCSGG
jgi:hypothetical protein